jgi:hypothetical protein
LNCSVVLEMHVPQLVQIENPQLERSEMWHNHLPVQNVLMKVL